MQIIKITSLWCPSCIIMNEILDDLSKKYNLNVINYDYDYDDDKIKEYNIGNTLPVIIFIKNNNEQERTIGEVKKQLLEEKIIKYL